MTTTARAPRSSFDVRLSDPPGAPGRARADAGSPGFGAVFTDHMVTIRWTAGRGWHDARLEPYGPLTLDPATAVLHYAPGDLRGLEGLPAGRRRRSRPSAREANAARFNRSARRLAMPELPEETFVRAIELLVAAGPRLGARRRRAQPLPAPVHDRHRSRARHQPALAVVPVRSSSPRPPAAYFPGGIKPVTVWLSAGLHPRRARAAPARPSAAATTPRASSASSRPWSTAATRSSGWTRVERRWVEEMGGMNLFFVYGTGPQPGSDARADRHAAARRHPRLSAQARRRPRHTRPRRAGSRPMTGARAARPAS